MKSNCTKSSSARVARHFALLGLLSLSHILAGAAWSATVVTNVLLPGSRFATECYVHDSEKPGKTIMIVGGAHGDEPAGAAAAESIRHWPITAGKLVVIPRANVPGLTAKTRLIPDIEVSLNNLNRNYPRAGKTEGPRGELAEAIWNVALDQKPGWLLDLHEGFDFNQINDKSVGSSVIVFAEETGTTAADLMLAAINETISDELLKFVRIDTPVDGSLARAGGEHLRIPSMTLETTSKQPLEKRVGQHEIMVRALFNHLGMFATSAPEASTVAGTGSAGRAAIRIALYKGAGTGGAGPTNLMKRLNRGAETSITQVSPEQIREGVLKDFDVVIFAGGSGSKQAAALDESGREAVREFVGDGGGYIGICAGAYLATSGYPWSLGLVNARTISPIWQRGRGIVKLELSDDGPTVLGAREGQFDCLYNNGPVVMPDDKEDLPAMSALAWFRTELANNDSPVGIMVDSPAIFSAAYKRGRVVCVSPHPEQTAGLEEIIPQAIQWTAARNKRETQSTLSTAE